jgi:hypothetical protein
MIAIVPELLPRLERWLDDRVTVALWRERDTLPWGKAGRAFDWRNALRHLAGLFLLALPLGRGRRLMPARDIPANRATPPRPFAPAFGQAAAFEGQMAPRFRAVLWRIVFVRAIPRS